MIQKSVKINQIPTFLSIFFIFFEYFDVNCFSFLTISRYHRNNFIASGDVRFSSQQRYDFDQLNHDLKTCFDALEETKKPSLDFTMFTLKML